jgi:hypothetical protein
VGHKQPANKLEQVVEAFAGLVEQRRPESPRPHVMAAFRASHRRFASLYRKLAK